MTSILKIHRCPKCGQASGQAAGSPELLSQVCDSCFTEEARKQEVERLLWEEAERIMQSGTMRLHGGH